MDRPVVKKVVVNLLSTLPYNNELAENVVYLITACGVITGKLTILEDRRDEDGNLIAEATSDRKSFVCITVDGALEAFYNEHALPSNRLLPGDEGFIGLHDVTIRPFNGAPSVSFSELIVFYDQIIACGLGTQARI